MLEISNIFCSFVVMGNITPYRRLFVEPEKYEIVKFVDNGFELEVNVSPAEETVWLTQDQMADLFQKTKSTINEHIKNAYAEGELCVGTMKKFGNSEFSKKPTNFYNLDVIISIGYHVKSPRGVLFRKWATSVLKQFMLKGYAIDPSRTLITNENYLNLLNVVTDMKSSQLDLENRVEKLENKYPELNEKVLWEGHMWDAVSCLENLISKAEKSIILIDDYVDRQTLDILSKKKPQTRAIIVTDDRNPNLTQKEIASFEKQNGSLTIKNSRIFHDRFLILDNNELFYCGASLKDAGRKVFAIGRIHDSEYLKGILSRI